MSAIAYKAGDFVSLIHDVANRPRPGLFEILRIMPSGNTAEEQYRVRGPDGRELAIAHYEVVEGAGRHSKT
jgi:hypothetical protein